MHLDKPWIESVAVRLGALPGHDWYLVQIKPNSAALALRNLTRQGFKTFAPMQTETRQVGERFRTATRLLFPGYLFVSLNSKEGSWRSVNSTIGVSRLVAFGCKPATVPRGLVEQIALRCDAEGLMLPPAALKPGDQVLVTSGPFTGFLAEVARCEADQRVWLLLDLMSQLTRVQMNAENVKRL